MKYLLVALLLICAGCVAYPYNAYDYDYYQYPSPYYYPYSYPYYYPFYPHYYFNYWSGGRHHGYGFGFH